MSELYHYGTLGMRWNRRKYTNKEGLLNRQGKNRYKTGNAIKKIGARYDAPMQKLGNITSLYKTKKKKHKRLSKGSIKKMGGRTAAESAISNYGGLKSNEQAFVVAMQYGRNLFPNL